MRAVGRDLLRAWAEVGHRHFHLDGKLDIVHPTRGTQAHVVVHQALRPRGRRAFHDEVVTQPADADAVDGDGAIVSQGLDVNGRRSGAFISAGP